MTDSMEEPHRTLWKLNHSYKWKYNYSNDYCFKNHGKHSKRNISELYSNTSTANKHIVPDKRIKKSYRDTSMKSKKIVIQQLEELNHSDIEFRLWKKSNNFFTTISNIKRTSSGQSGGSQLLYYK